MGIYYKLKDDSQATIDAPVSAGDTIIVLGAWQGANLPDLDPGETSKIALWQLVSSPTVLNVFQKFEVVLMTNKSWDVITVTRAQDGTIAQSFLVWDIVGCFVLASHLTQMQTIIDAKLDLADYISWDKIYWSSTTWTDAYAITLSDVSALTDWMRVFFDVDTANTAAATLDVSSLGAKDLTIFGWDALQTWYISAWQIVEATRDAANDYWEVISVVDNSDVIITSKFTENVTLWETITAGDQLGSIYIDDSDWKAYNTDSNTASKNRCDWIVIQSWVLDDVVPMIKWWDLDQSAVTEWEYFYLMKAQSLPEQIQSWYVFTEKISISWISWTPTQFSFDLKCDNAIGTVQAEAMVKINWVQEGSTQVNVTTSYVAKTITYTTPIIETDIITVEIRLNTGATYAYIKNFVIEWIDTDWRYWISANRNPWDTPVLVGKSTKTTQINMLIDEQNFVDAYKVQEPHTLLDNTVYQAETDWFVVAYITWSWSLKGYMDAIDATTQITAFSWTEWTAVFPVTKWHYYKVVQGSASLTGARFYPLST